MNMHEGYNKYKNMLLTSRVIRDWSKEFETPSKISVCRITTIFVQFSWNFWIQKLQEVMIFTKFWEDWANIVDFY